MRWTIITRADPPLPLARLRARRQLLEVRAADLRFTLEETTEYLSSVMQLALSGDSVAGIGSSHGGLGDRACTWRAWHCKQAAIGLLSYTSSPAAIVMLSTISWTKC